MGPNKNMKRFSLWQRINPFFNPTTEQIAANAIEDTKIAIMDHENNSLYHKKMAEYQREKLAFLQSQISTIISEE